MHPFYVMMAEAKWLIYCDWKMERMKELANTIKNLTLFVESEKEKS